MASSTVPPVLLWRIGRRPDPLVWPPWQFVGDNRFDDPGREFRVLYAAQQRVACFLELLAAWRPSLALLAALQALPDGERGDDTPPPSAVPTDWRHKRLMGNLLCPLDQPWLDLRDRAAREEVRHALAPTLHRLGLTDLDFGDLLTRDRRITQAIARWAHEMGYDVIAYKSRLGPDLDCWALFESARFLPLRVSAIAADDPDYLAALRDLKLSPE